MSKLHEYYKDPAKSEKNIADYIMNPQNNEEEIKALVNVMDCATYEKAEVVFYVEVLVQSTKKQKELALLMEAVFGHIEKEISYKNSIYLLRLLKAIGSTRLYTPLVYYLTKIISEADSDRKTGRTGKSYGFDKVRLSSDDLKSEELQLFVVGEAMSQIRRFLEVFGSSIGFPELASTICGELKKRCKKGEYKEEIGEFIKAVNRRKEYIEKERASKNIDISNGKLVKDFEGSLEKWVLV